MEKHIITILVMAVILLTGCNSNPKDDKHVHVEGDDHVHVEGDDHTEEAEKVEKDDHTDEIIFTSEQAAIAGLEIYTVKPGAFSSVIKTSGQIATAPGDEATIVATSNGIISFSNQSISIGAPVKAGATILTISAKNLSDGDPIAKLRIAYETALKEYNRAESLVKDKIISTKEFEQVRSRYQTAKTSYQAQSSKVTAAGVRIESPINGYITSMLVSSGDYVSVGQPIATVSQNKKLLLIADVPESQFGLLKTIRNANFVTPYNNTAYKLSEMNGRLLSFGRSSNKTSFYIPVTFEFNNIGDIIPGSFVEVYLLSTPKNDVISIPISALTEEQGIYFVYVEIGEEEFKKREVVLGESNGERFSILSGLHDGDKVVSTGAYQVKLAASSSMIPEGHAH